MGTVAISQHTQIHIVSDNCQRCGLSDRALRLIYGHAVAADCHPDALGESDHGYICSHGTRVAASVAVGDAGKTAPAKRIHHQRRHVADDYRHRDHLLRVAHVSALLL